MPYPYTQTENRMNWQPQPNPLRHGLRCALLVFLLGSATACAQPPQQETNRTASAPRPDLYQCDGCEVAAERTAEELTWEVHLPPDGEPGERLVLTGQVLMPDGQTPAPGVVLYLHQTNAAGRYRSVRSTSGGGRTDGMIQGWLATDATGRYAITTVKPGPYPDGGMPAHIHVYVKEPDRRPYYIDDFVFEGDPHLTPAYRANQELRGGSGILQLKRQEDGSWRGTRNVVLER